MGVDGPELDTLLLALVARADERSELSIDVLNAALPSGFPVELLDDVFEALWRARVTVIVPEREERLQRRRSRHGRPSEPTAASRPSPAPTAAPVVPAAPGRDDERASDDPSTMLALTAQEQMDLLANPTRHYMGRMAESRRLTVDEERILLERAVAGDEAARQELIHAYLPIVARVARRYRRSGVPFMELVLAGNEGLVEAAHHLTSADVPGFASTARWWIGHHLSRCIAENWRANRIPRREARRLRRMAAVVARYRAKRRHDPSPEFLARALRLPLDEVFFLKGLFESPLSLHAPVGDSSEAATLADLIPDTHAPDGAVAAERRAVRAQLSDMLDCLDVVERRVIVLRFGLGDGVSRSLEEVGRLVGHSRDDVRSIERQGLEKLRARGRTVHGRA